MVSELEEMTLNGCPKCGAAVKNAELHKAWHDALPGDVKRAVEADQRFQNLTQI